MPTSKPPYPAEFRQQMVELARAGRGLKQLSREFGVSANAIRNWVHQDAGGGGVGRCTPRVRRRCQRANGRSCMNCVVSCDKCRWSATSSAKATAWFAGKSEQDVHDVFELVNANQADVPVRSLCRVLARVRQRLLRLARSRAPSAGPWPTPS